VRQGCSAGRARRRSDWRKAVIGLTTFYLQRFIGNG